MADIRYFYNVDYDALHFQTGSLKINIFQVLFWEGEVTKKNTLWMLLIMLTPMDDLLTTARGKAKTT